MNLQNEKDFTEQYNDTLQYTDFTETTQTSDVKVYSKCHVASDKIIQRRIASQLSMSQLSSYCI